MKFLIILSVAMFGLITCQRPPYAASPQRYPAPHPWFTSSTAAPTVDLGDRAGVPAGTTVSTEPTTTIRLPVDARGDAELVKQIATWPKEKQPFWYLNWKAIEDARSKPQPVQNSNQAGQAQPALAQPGLVNRSPFLGSGRTTR